MRFKDVNTGEFKRSIDFATDLESVRFRKIEELYNAYQSDKLGDVVSSIIGADGNAIIFEYGEDNQSDYTKIGTKFALNTTLTDSIIGSKSHGKFYITREDYTTLVGDFDNHETSLYVKFKQLKTDAENATSTEEIEAIEW